MTVVGLHTDRVAAWSFKVRAGGEAEGVGALRGTGGGGSTRLTAQAVISTAAASGIKVKGIRCVMEL